MKPRPLGAPKTISELVEAHRNPIIPSIPTNGAGIDVTFLYIDSLISSKSEEDVKILPTLKLLSYTDETNMVHHWT